MIVSNGKVHLTKTELSRFNHCVQVQASSPMTVAQYNQLIEDEALFYASAQTPEGILMAATTRLGLLTGDDATTQFHEVSAQNRKVQIARHGGDGTMSEEHKAALMQKMREKYPLKARAADALKVANVRSSATSN